MWKPQTWDQSNRVRVSKEILFYLNLRIDKVDGSFLDFMMLLFSEYYSVLPVIRNLLWLSFYLPQGMVSIGMLILFVRYKTGNWSRWSPFWISFILAWWEGMEWINYAGNLLPVGFLMLNLFIRFCVLPPILFSLGNLDGG